MTKTKRKTTKKKSKTKIVKSKAQRNIQKLIVDKILQEKINKPDCHRISDHSYTNVLREYGCSEWFTKDASKSAVYRRFCQLNKLQTHQSSTITVCRPLILLPPQKITVIR